jgi:hypothetical protein
MRDDADDLGILKTAPESAHALDLPGLQAPVDVGRRTTSLSRCKGDLTNDGPPTRSASILLARSKFAIAR